MEIKNRITFSEYLEIENKLDIRLGVVISSERVPKSEKLLMLQVNFGDDENIKTCVTNIGDRFRPEELFLKTIPFVVNLEPSKMMGIVSEVMIVVGLGTENQLQVGFDVMGIGTKLI